VSIDANGAQATNYSWTIPAKAIKQYTASPSSYQTGAVQNLQANDLNQTTVAFYWLDGAFSGGQSKKVTFSCKVNNKTYSAEANFTVFRPKSDITTVVNPDNVPAGTELINIYTPGPIFGFGKGNLAPPRGIEFTSANFEMPAGFTGLSHNLSWLQKISGTTINRQANDGKWKDCTGNGLDSEFTYQNANAKTTPADDAPAVELFSSEKRVIVSDNFEMYLMFKPDGQDSIYVPLRRVLWQWGGSANRDTTTDAWSVSTRNYPSISNQEVSDEPVWTQVITSTASLTCRDR
jgi:hypothetical protein